MVTSATRALSVGIACDVIIIRILSAANLSGLICSVCALGSTHTVV
jgi:hypothetical protein